uniref:Uncharacterized protein n=1 Tax=Arundo donax TaxID=35708 RepID=A0A0A9HC29_ARUDO
MRTCGMGLGRGFQLGI